MEDKLEILESLKDLNCHISTDWIMEHILKLDPLLINRKLKIDKILNGKTSGYNDRIS